MEVLCRGTGTGRTELIVEAILRSYSAELRWNQRRETIVNTFSYPCQVVKESSKNVQRIASQINRLANTPIDCFRVGSFVVFDVRRSARKRIRDQDCRHRDTGSTGQRAVKQETIFAWPPPPKFAA